MEILLLIHFNALILTLPLRQLRERLVDPLRDLRPDGLARGHDRGQVRRQRWVRPKVVRCARDQERRLLRVDRGADHARGGPGVDLAVGEHDARALRTVSARNRVSKGDVARHNLGRFARGGAKGLRAKDFAAEVDLLLHHTQPPREGALRAVLARLEKGKLGAGLVQPNALWLDVCCTPTRDNSTG